jgi:hypothetical protein
MPVTPVAATPITHLKRAFGWNLGSILPSEKEGQALDAAGLTEPTVRRYAAWRRSLLIVAFVPTLLAASLAAFDVYESGLGEFTAFGVGLELAWVVAAFVLSLACLIGIGTWTRPGRGASLLAAAWAFTFVLPFVHALLPVNAIYHVQTSPAASKPSSDSDDEEPSAKLSPEKLEKLQAVQELTVEFVLSGGGYLLLFPAVLSLIPGVVNGCLRIKSLIPASQLSGWLLVCAAPAFLLFWAIVLVLANHAARSPLLVFGVILWAGAPIWYSVRGRVFVQSQIGDAEAARIARVKRLVGLTTLLGVGLLVAFLLTTKVVGLKVIGFERAKAVSTKLEELSDADDEVSLEDVQMALAESKSFVYAFDLSSWRMIVDFLAKLLVVTAVFADLVLRATVAAWRNDRAMRARQEATGYDNAAAAVDASLFGPG